jgi:hypothetical protein
MRSLVLTFVVGCATLLACAAARGGDFSIENKVFDGKELVGSSTTIIVDAKAYDFLSSPNETIILAPLDGRIVLLDNTRQVRADVTLAELTAFCEQLIEKARRSPSEAVRFLAAPEFREQIDPETQELVLAGPYLDYRARTIAAPDAATLKSYEQFLTWQVRLNALIHPGSAPPSARLKLNEALVRRQSMAEEVTMKRTSIVPGFGKTLRAEHRFTWKLGEPERRRIDEADTRCGAYRVVPVTEYVNPLVEQARR